MSDILRKEISVILWLKLKIKFGKLLIFLILLIVSCSTVPINLKLFFIITTKHSFLLKTEYILKHIKMIQENL